MLQTTTPESEVSAHPESPFDVITGSRPERIGAGHGLLEITLRPGPRSAGRGRTRRYPLPRTPLLLIDSQPVLQGEGRAWVRLPPGSYRCSVQAGGFAGWWTTAIERGRTTVLDARPDRARRRGRLPLVPDRFVEKPRYWTVPLYLPVAFAFMLVFGLVLLCVISTFAPVLIDQEWKRMIAFGIFLALTLALWGHMAARHIGNMRHGKFHIRAQTALAAEPRSGSGPPVHALPAFAAEVPSPEAGGVLLDLNWEVVQQGAAGTDIDRPKMQHHGEPAPSAHHPWLGDPAVAIDGDEVPLSWGRWWIPLQPGPHRIAVSNPEQAESGERSATWNGTVETEANRVSCLRLNATVVQCYENDRYTLRVNAFEHTGHTYRAEERLTGFHRPRREAEPLDGRNGPRYRHSLTDVDTPGRR